MLVVHLHALKLDLEALVGVERDTVDEAVPVAAQLVEVELLRGGWVAEPLGAVRILAAGGLEQDLESGHESEQECC